MKTPIYFAYGSNMLQERLERRVGQVKKIGSLKIHGFKLAFNCGNFEAYANMVKATENDFVEGILYELEEVQISRLDSYEGWPWGYQKFYQIHGEDIIYCYICTNTFRLSEQSRPSLQYLQIVIAGATENGLNHTLTILNQIEYEVREYHLKAKPKKTNSRKKTGTDSIKRVRSPRKTIE